MSRNATWFPHDTDALFDEKCAELTKRHGAEGYGAFWAVIEAMRKAADYRIKLNGRTAGPLALFLRMDEAVFVGMVEDMASTEIELLKTDGEWYWSESLNRRIAKYEALIKSRSYGGKKGMAKRWNNSVITQLQDEDNSVITDDNYRLIDRISGGNGSQKPPNATNHPPTDDHKESDYITCPNGHTYRRELRICDDCRQAKLKTEWAAIDAEKANGK